MAGKGESYGILLQMLAVSPVTQLESVEVDDSILFRGGLTAFVIVAIEVVDLNIIKFDSGDNRDRHAFGALRNVKNIEVD